jgi:alkylhydroperoxidase family enzyme
VKRVETRYDGLIEQLRVAAEPDRPVPEAFEPYVRKVRERAYTVVDGDVEQLRAAGFTEDVIFEQTVSTAVAAGLDRLAAALGTLG